MIISIVLLSVIALLAMYVIGFRHGFEAGDNPHRRTGDRRLSDGDVKAIAAATFAATSRAVMSSSRHVIDTSGWWKGQ